MDISCGIPNFEFDFYFSDKILKQLQLSESSNVFKVNSKNVFQKLQAADYDLVIIGTVHRYFNVFKKISENYNTSIIVHNRNFSNVNAMQLLRNIPRQGFIFRTKLLLKEALLSAPKVYRNSKKLVLDKAFCDINYQYLPLFYTHHSTNKFSNSDEITVVVPGAVSQQRRDYNHVFQELREIQNSKLKVIFLGKVSGSELSLLQKLDSEKNPNFELVYFTEKVPQSIFDEWMRKADVLWCPVQQETEFFSVKEVYGSTKMTGNIRDAIKYGKPAIFPKNYTSNSAFIFLESDDLEAQLQSMKNSSVENLKMFEKTEIQKQFSELLQKLI